MQTDIHAFRSNTFSIQLVTDKVYHVPGWEPVPIMRFFNRVRDDDTQILIAASIGALQWTLKSREQLDHFMNRAIPTFCTQTSPSLCAPSNYGTIEDTIIKI